MTTADPLGAAPPPALDVAPPPAGAWARAGTDATDARAALAAARLDAPGGRAQLEHLLRPAARRYAVDVLVVGDAGTADAIVEASVARALRTLPRDLGPDELTDHLHLAVRHEAWQRQRGGDRATRLLATAAIVAVVLAMGALAIAVGRAMGDPDPTPVAVVHPVEDLAVAGRVVDTTAGGRVLGGRADLEVTVLTGGDEVVTIATDDAGRFEVDGLDPGSYEIRLDVPSGLRLRGAPDGRSTTVELVAGSASELVLELQRP